ncbi:MAG: hypothetical protein JWM32_2509 [Verrucomicrobia bacterium]|nr:hypothetical protein [Verrucomicrobiota bacterium]
MLTTGITPNLLSEPEWQERKAAHEARVQAWLHPHQRRAAQGEKHPVYDFLFSYYAFRPAWLLRWHPGPDIVLARAGTEEPWPFAGYVATADGVSVDLSALSDKRRDSVRWIRDLLAAMKERPPFFGCFGLHEWAMVYQQTPEEVRHNEWPLRFAPAELAQIVEAQPLCCTHFDAFRFFTPSARPLNRLQPERSTAPQHEQRGCLHANMDLYKWAFKLAPLTPSELVADCFELARDIREIDMRASPYDLRALGFEPIAIETTTGRAEYEQHQRSFTQRGEPLRERLIGLCDRLLAGSTATR